MLEKQFRLQNPLTDLLQYQVTSYHLQQKATVQLTLEAKAKSVYYAHQLDAELRVYQNGVVGIEIKERGSPMRSDDFRASQFAGVEWDNLAENSGVRVTEGESTLRVEFAGEDEPLELIVNFDPFEVKMYVQGEYVMGVNPGGNKVLLENANYYYRHNDPYAEDRVDIASPESEPDFFVDPRLQPLFERLITDGAPFESKRYEPSNSDPYNPDFKHSVSLGFHMPHEHLYGLPERAFQFRLKTTEDIGPYRLFNQDLFPHSCDANTNLYGSVPYLTGHSTSSDASIAWLNAGDTWVSLLNQTKIDGAPGTLVSFTSEAPVLEFFIFGSKRGPWRVQKQLADLSGYP